MDDLIKQITSKFDIDADKARGIVGTVISFLKDKLPGPLAGQLAKFAGNEAGGDDDDDGGGLMDKAKGMFGG